MIVPPILGIPWPEREATRRPCGKTGNRAVDKVAHTPGQGLRAQTPRPLAVEVVIDDAGYFAGCGRGGPVGLLAFHDASFSLVNAGLRFDDHYVTKAYVPWGRADVAIRTNALLKPPICAFCHYFFRALWKFRDQVHGHSGCAYRCE